jgi:two-component system, OmpR family, phosphate regulon sensor histidine kinase PhoR
VTDPAWLTSLWRGLAVVLLGGLLGLFFQQVLLGALLAAIAVWIAQMVAMTKLRKVMHSRQWRHKRLEPIAQNIAAIHFHQRTADREKRKQLLGALGDFQRAANALPDGVLLLYRTHFKLEWFNSAAARLLGLQTPKDRYVSLLRRLPMPTFVAWLSQAKDNELLLDQISPIDNSVRLSFRLAPYDEDRVLLIVRDVSHLYRLEQVRKDFVANVSHELRTPLTVINGYLDTLEEDEDDMLAGVIGPMREQGQRMAGIVDDLLTLSRLDQQSKVREEQVDMSAMLASLCDDANALSGGAHRIELVRNDGGNLLGDSKDLRSAFSNLLTNAVRYTPAGGDIRVAWFAQANELIFEVSDTGPGIPAEHVPRLTERFYRVSTSRSREKGGTGLGLAIVKHVLTLHQAHLDISSELGKGSVFRAVFKSVRQLKLPHAGEKN